MMKSEKLSDRKKVGEWLDSINCKNEQERQEVMNLCASDIEARVYFVMRWNKDCKK